MKNRYPPQAPRAQLSGLQKWLVLTHSLPPSPLSLCPNLLAVWSIMSALVSFFFLCWQTSWAYSFIPKWQTQPPSACPKLTQNLWASIPVFQERDPTCPSSPDLISWQFVWGKESWGTTGGLHDRWGCFFQNSRIETAVLHHRNSELSGWPDR